MGHQAQVSESTNGNNPFSHLKKPLTVKIDNGNSVTGEYYDLVAGFGEEYTKLPFSIRILLESAVRKCDNVLVKESDVQRIASWIPTNKEQDVEIQFSPARVVLQDFTGVPAVVDLAAMRDAVVALGGNAENVNPVCPTDLVIDHSVQVDYFGDINALEKNQELEFSRNHERFAFLKWGATAFKNMLIVPPGNGIVHQVNLEYLARVVFTKSPDVSTPTLFYPDSVVGTDSHTTMINGLGVLGWGVGGIEAEAVMMGLPMSMVLPEVVGYKLIGELGRNVTSTDVVLTITKNLRQLGVVGKFVEFFGSGLCNLSIADRATISNMCPEYGATCAFFPVDGITIQYLRQSNRDNTNIAIIKEYLKANGLYKRNSGGDDNQIRFSQVVELDLSTVVTCLSGPKRPHDKVDLTSMKQDFLSCLQSKIGFKGYGIPEDKMQVSVPFTHDGVEYTLRHGSVLIAAITSCTNTSNPSVMLGAGLMARKAVQAGLAVPKYLKTSLSPGSGVVTYYLNESGVIEDLKALGFDIVGYGCMTCIGNSGPLPEEVEKVVEGSDLVCCGVLSGNRNFEGRIHPLLRANYLASPLLVIAYALAGRVDIDFEKDPVQGGVFLRDIWPSREEIRACEEKFVLPRMFKSVYEKIQDGNPRWNGLDVEGGVVCYKWDDNSSYIRKPPFVENKDGTSRGGDMIGARCLLYLGDSVTTDHISPAGSIARNSPAARYLAEDMGLSPKDFNSYGSRRGNDEVMVRGTFANIRLVNKLNKDGNGSVVAGPRTLYIPTNEIMDVYDASMRYSVECADTPLIVVAGKDYGSGSSRDWAAKGPKLLNIRVVIAESYERIHRSNLVGMGVLPLQFADGESGEVLGLNGTEKFNVYVGVDGELKPKGIVRVETCTGKSFNTVVRIDTDVELEYYKNGGILPYLVKRIAGDGV